VKARMSTSNRRESKNDEEKWIAVISLKHFETDSSFPDERLCGKSTERRTSPRRQMMILRRSGEETAELDVRMDAKASGSR
jgi:hypothetical protein